MRYEKADNLLQLALEMQASRAGLSLGYIQDKFAVGRRTAMRMRDAILRNFPQAEEVETEERVKRWRIPSGVLNQMVNFSADELSSLDTAVNLLRQENREEVAAEVASVLGKVRALMKPEAARRVEPDLEALLEAEGLAMRPGPRPSIKVAVTEDLRHAMKGCTKVRLSYRNREGKLNDRLVHPYGFLHGHRHYLVAFHEHPKGNNVVLFSLPNIERVEVLKEMFVRPEEFSLSEYARRSFALYQEEPFDVVWKFTPEAALVAKEFIFHPTQTLEELRDGSLIVRFRAGGDLEMAWHLYTWGDQVEVLEPEKLKAMAQDHRVRWKALP
ncbi:MAG: WYL domain-containing protein [Alphaproteobacteria bacterium RIFOXYD12_FULL_60_8]|nr:MAG: WYL domain-containing protein [Alphaproteobacteria bacterium RIFOXYD12_FULL_60_8]